VWVSDESKRAAFAIDVIGDENLIWKNFHSLIGPEVLNQQFQVSTAAMPRLAPVIKTVLFSMFI